MVNTHRLQPSELAALYVDGFASGVYAVQFPHGVKIGTARDIPTRVKALVRLGEIYSCLQRGDVIVSRPHTNHRENERRLHLVFKKKRIAGELFSVSLEEAREAMEGLEFKDEREAQAADRAQSLIWWKKFLAGGGTRPITPTEKPVEEVRTPLSDLCTTLGVTRANGAPYRAYVRAGVFIPIRNFEIVREGGKYVHKYGYGWSMTSSGKALISKMQRSDELDAASLAPGKQPEQSIHSKRIQELEALIELERSRSAA